ncbi:50S ribosomal protein L11 methyltransferase [Aquabacterium lacunae]|uniref:Ribosomal protein L11 methyltransferase n=1 Tax=Aquabacterium lacunae TaxID=2528630 RepID=A0A4Q9H619_9BURK|nr:50S ribosomal protein L11 methyltransferase [Aquabacterium lacunae]TBO34520.1 50S ribosomal protein L11 methyltransferase [Aquabacterium lacunae]
MHELTLLTTEAHVEILTDALMEIETLAVSVEDADADTEQEEALWGEPGMPVAREGWQRSTVKCLFPDEASALEAATLILAQDWASEIHVQGIQEVPDQDWVRLTQSQFSPVPVTADFWIVPTWHEVPEAARTVIRLDPGLAFGTGTHPTTRMCLQWIAENAAALQGQRALDYGCGSGILAIGAALHGATQVDAVDIDPAAVEATLANADVNLSHLKAADGHTPISAGLPDLVGDAQGSYPVVLANILATPLKMLSPLLAGHVAAGGHLVLAGILARQEQELKDAYAEVGLQLSVANTQDGWILMTARKAA